MPTTSCGNCDVTHKCYSVCHARDPDSDRSFEMNKNQQEAQRTDFVVNKADFSQQAFRHRKEMTPLLEGQVRLAVDKFALTANNITYALVGDDMQYWNFFPSEEDGMGRVPVWGFANVIESRCEGIQPGERIYGFLPISTDFIASPVSVSGSGFVDGAEHRQSLHPIYNQYTKVSGDPSYVASLEAQQMILRPLFMTSFLIEDFLRNSEYFGAGRIILTSASSKTAIGTAYQLAHAENRPRELLGLTSERNRDFVVGLGLYDTVVSYDDIESIDLASSSVLLDMAGNGDVLQRLHVHLGDELKYSCRVGASHWDADAVTAELAGPVPRWFFAPAQFQERVEEIGTARLLQQFAAAWTGFSGSTKDWMEIVERQGEDAIQETFKQLLDGNARPSSAFILSF
jgi:hypothetical protein